MDKFALKVDFLNEIGKVECRKQKTPLLKQNRKFISKSTTDKMKSPEGLLIGIK